MIFLSTVYQYQRGPSVTLIFSSCIDKGTSKEEETKSFLIADLVEVRFKFEYNADKIKCYLSAMKLKSKIRCVRIMVTCEDLKYSEPWQIHTEEWTAYRFMGSVLKFYCGNDKLVSNTIIQIMISVSEVNASNLLTKVYEDTDCIDFHLKASDGDVGVHRVFLAAHSDVFRTMLNGKWKETAEGCVEVEGVTRQTLQHLKDYMYLDTLPEDGLCPLLLLAKYYLMDDLKTKCIRKLTETVKSDNLYALLEYACENNIPELTLEMLHFIPDKIVNLAYKEKKRTF